VRVVIVRVHLKEIFRGEFDLGGLYITLKWPGVWGLGFGVWGLGFGVWG
jgi:hypothetical protein